MSVSIKEKMFFVENLSLMIKGGIPIAEALETLKKEVKSKTFKKALDDILKRILEGGALSEAMSSYPKIFDKFFENVVKLGEKSGTLQENLRYLALHLRKDYEMKKNIRGAMIYPAIIIIVGLIIAFTVTFFILPKITDLLKILGVELPLATKILINSSSFFKENSILIISGLIFVILIFKFILKLKFIKFYFDKTSLSLPIFGQIFRNLSLARFSRFSYTLFKSGMPVLEALKISSDSLPNEVYKRNLTSVRLEVERGGKISQGLKNFPKVFSLTFCQMISIGEKTGALEESFLYLARFYERESTSVLKNLSAILEPILLILVGVFVGFIALAIITPIYRFTGSLRFR
ncbi:hypothetical protein AMJ49_02335 [Parcubacteria bacterium DG_74_2]|nr:MAG: hypothetical protein AMJ49_02335 [Parcubacteria bacterium DG_74_2]